MRGPREGGPQRLCEWAARRLEPELARRYREEWLADLSFMDSPVARWHYALCLLATAHRMRAPRPHSEPRTTLRWVLDGLGLLGVGSMVALKVAPNQSIVPLFLLTIPFVIRLGVNLPGAAGRFLVNTALEINHFRRPALPPAVRRHPEQEITPPDHVAVIITALEVEQRAVRAHLETPAEDLVTVPVRGTLYEVGRFGSWTVAVAQVGAGNTTAGIHLERAMWTFNPEVVLFVGVAGGLREVRLGDVVVADLVLDYESAKEVDGAYLPRIHSQPAPHRLVQRAQAVARNEHWQQRIAPGSPAADPVALVRPIAAGSKVVADDHARTAELLRRLCSEAVAVEMEGFGFLQGAHLNGGVDAAVVRGVSDLLSDKDSAHDQCWQPVAAGNAAAFAFELLDSLSGVAVR
ncbi:hypothetical protein GCM10010174_17240 [Kutzneria viridogrisea]|uniref:Nucleoside phosphorylase domain-containing protein n=2 Tax=Kutzneria TaxID=43356 RepID=W5WG34_9PSEU|nr:5'-methylthioadenosine/S-adenosylhomocysteine nucleosidase [Kutzneria albida]AHH99700.1 hypothetical protein KALB_6340 [Kutzneria albida DSM 43870]MBA8924876.1 nucleoside phosphorylase [Kutzneria viridogrisea]